ncbi:hypothetical protein HUG10_12200 [Halorarum halophilum]|uniref:Uncharacterized protein n=1 Tax=Halorarum halophilum TaxID=2743090 RepID=A0A7D5L2U7_9EURY|nr:hypothetical protein [Halobaculum halophilum]QLG28263.1 hypothetical protein HUG10_12200 [Halobaculum halophilum]
MADSPEDSEDARAEGYGFEWVESAEPSDVGTSDAPSDSPAETEVTVRISGEPSRRLGGPAEDERGDSNEPSESGSTASAELPRPPAAFRESDPTGASWWQVLAVGTVAWAFVATAWSLPFAIGDLPVPSLSGGLSSAAEAGVLVALAAAALVRLVVLPAALLRDATLLRRADAVEWSPSRRFYGPAVVLAPLPTCCLYLLKRRRYVGTPTTRYGDRFAFYEGRTVPSNWWVIVAVGVLLGGVTEVLVAVSEGIDALPDGVGMVLSGPLLAAVAGVLFLRVVLVPLAFYHDATAVRRADVGWRPLALWYAIGGLVLALPFGLFYLYRRVRYTDVGPF